MIRLLSVLICLVIKPKSIAIYIKNAIQFQSLSYIHIFTYPMFLCLALITHYILLFLKSFRYCINIIKYIYVIYIILKIFSCEFLKRHCVY